MVSSARFPATTASGTAEPGSDYFATEAHYLSLAGRLTAASRDRRFVLVVGDPPANPRLISKALRKVTQGRRAVIDICCGGELNFQELSRASCTQAAEPLPLFVFDEVDQLSDQQIVQICEAIPRKADESAAVVLLAHAGFPGRLEAPSLKPVKEALTAQFRLDEIGEDESIDFLRHQLQARHRGDDEGRGIASVIFGAVAAVGVVVAIGFGAMLAMHYIDNGGTITGTVAIPSPPPAARPSSFAVANPSPSVVANPSPSVVANPSPSVAAAPPPAAAAPAPSASTAMSAAAEPAPAADAAPPQPSTPFASPSAPQSPAVARLPRAEIAALVARGDDFLRAGDIASARLYYERAADAGDGSAALRLGATFDPGFLTSAGVRGTPGDPARAASWYARAVDLGEAVAAQHLKSLDHSLDHPGR